MLLLFFLIWIILNGRVTVEVIMFGIVISAVMFLFIQKFMGYSVEKEKWLYKNAHRLIGYCFVLIWEILKANMDVAKRIFSMEYDIEPAVVHFKSPLKSRVCNALLANSITLTPGTITVSAENGEFVVHCIDKELAEGIDKSVFVKLLLKIEGEEDDK